MHPEAAFLTGYALALVVLAAGLDALGRRSTDPWASRVLAASRPPDVEPAEQRTSWPHSDVPVIYVCVSGVALAAALVLTVGSAVRHHRPLELAIHLVVLAVISVRALRLHRRHRAAPVEQERPPVPGHDGDPSPVRGGS